MEIVDPYFGQLAFTLTLPENWKLEGTVLRGPNGAAPDVVFRASSPDGLTGVQQLPRYDWIWTADPQMAQFYRFQNMMLLAPMTVGDFLTTVAIPEIRPGAQVGTVEPVPDLDEKLAEKDRNANAQLLAAAQPFHTPPSQVSSAGARVRIEYNLNGQPVEEWIATVITRQDFPGVGAPPHSQSQAWVRGSRAPRGQLDSSIKMLREIFNSVKPNPAWEQNQKAFANQQFQQATQARRSFACRS